MHGRPHSDTRRSTLGRQNQQGRRFRPTVELLEARLVLFKSWLTLEPNHEYITAAALPFLREDVLDEINYEHVVQETLEAFSSAAHMDNCEMKQSATRINQYYARAVQAADPNRFDSEATAEWFGKLLHAVQDFYAHSNWVDNGMQTLLEQNEGPWDSLNPYSYHDGALLVQGTNQEPFGPGSLARSGFRVTVRVYGINYPGIVTGTFGFGDHQCPRNVALAHGSPISPRGLNKDGPNEYNGALFYDAAWLAMVQTGHEFYRLYRMIEVAYGSAQHLLDAWVQPGSGPGGNASQFLTLRREQPEWLPPQTEFFPRILPVRFSIPEMDKRYLPRLAESARALGVPNHPHLAILNSGDYAARLALGEKLHGHTHHEDEELAHDEHSTDVPPRDLIQVSLVIFAANRIAPTIWVAQEPSAVSAPSMAYHDDDYFLTTDLEHRVLLSDSLAGVDEVVVTTEALFFELTELEA